MKLIMAFAFVFRADKRCILTKWLASVGLMKIDGLIKVSNEHSLLLLLCLAIRWLSLSLG